MRIDILKKPEENCQYLVETLTFAVKKVNLTAEINVTHNFAAFPDLSVSPSQTPIVFINGSVEFVKTIPPIADLQKKLLEIGREGGMAF